MLRRDTSHGSTTAGADVAAPGAQAPGAGAAPAADAAPRWLQAAFVAVCAVLVLLPLVGMLWAPTTTTTENRELAAFPQLVEDGQPNESFLSELGDWFEDHFAFRNQLVNANATLRAAVFGTSATENVVVGTDGWLYYGGTLADYTGEETLSERAVDNIAYNLALMQDYVETLGADFTVAFAPNKNTLYAANMPYYYQASAEEHDLVAVQEALDEYGVSYTDLYGQLSAADETLYYLRDSHWNTKGAYYASQWLSADLGHDASALEGLEGTLVSGYEGDLASMLYPTGTSGEDDYDYTAWLDFGYEQGESVEDSEVLTSGAGTETLVMYRDSFTNNLLPFLASSYEQAYFTKLVPYDLTQVALYGADDVIVERAERHLDDIGTAPAIMPAPSEELDVAYFLTGTEEESSLAAEQDGSYLVVEGIIPEDYREEGYDIYVGVETSEGMSWYTPFHISTDESDYGYEAYLGAEALEDAQRVVVASVHGQMVRVLDALELADDGTPQLLEGEQLQAAAEAFAEHGQQLADEQREAEQAAQAAAEKAELEAQSERILQERAEEEEAAQKEAEEEAARQAAEEAAAAAAANSSASQEEDVCVDDLVLN